MSYDVPVKLFSLQLMLMAWYIVLQDHRRLLCFFILNKVAPPKPEVPFFTVKRAQYIMMGVQLAIICFELYSIISTSVEGRKQYGSYREKSPLYGVYDVAFFIQNQDSIAPLLTDTVRWKKLLVDYPDRVTIVKMDDSMRRLQCELDTLHRTFAFWNSEDTTRQIMRFVRSRNTLVLDGVLFGDTLRIGFSDYEMDQFGLINRGFHWVNEVPFNRYNLSR